MLIQHMCPALVLVAAVLTLYSPDGSSVNALDIEVRSSPRVNQAPSLDRVPNRTVPLGKCLTFRVRATDEDDDPIQYHLDENAPAGAAIHRDVGLFSWTPSKVGVYRFEIQASDPGYRFDAVTITITVIPELRRTELESEELESHWRKLAKDEWDVVEKSIWALVASPKQGVEFLGTRLKPIPTPDAKRLAQLISDLDDDRPKVREHATLELEKLGELARPTLIEILKGQPSAEAKERAKQLLAKLDRQAPSLEVMQILRAIEVLEHIGTPEAKEVLDKLTKGAPSARITEDAKASLQRLAKRQAASP